MPAHHRAPGHQDRSHEQKMLTTYLLKPGRHEAALGVLARHWPLLRRQGLVTGEPSWIAHGQGGDGPFIVELVTWGVPGAVDRAYLDPEINSLWQEMFALTEARGARPPVDWPAVTRLTGGAAHDTPADAPLHTLTTYQVREGRTERLAELLPSYWDALARAGLLAPGAPALYAGENLHGPFLTEHLAWSDPHGPAKASGEPAAGALYARAAELAEERGDRPGVERCPVKPLHFGFMTETVTGEDT
ncbi:hypothetical protein AQJ11_07335 [Streptomyces corchorusii]|uniref:Uncharacterized protein n=2 Tax=Streptomyces TaxID=1883 RepID=A0A101QJW9_STRCK|nr:hypothetical protein [Streptomyces corchorusii]ALO98405.1 hypothetical protein SHL15_7397 [Streptomyces hygroscopicus subsp. limoneus]KUN31295.1 hypothetical protein AQJ11_07335 [Streptomyces corchorusii]